MPATEMRMPVHDESFGLMRTSMLMLDVNRNERAGRRLLHYRATASTRFTRSCGPWRPRRPIAFFLAHLVPDRLLRRRDHLARAAGLLDLLLGGLGEVVGLHGQLLGQFAVAEDADAVERCRRRAASLLSAAMSTVLLASKRFEVADVDDRVVLVPGGVG